MPHELAPLQTRNLQFETTHDWTPLSQTMLIDCRRCNHCGTISYRVAFGYMYYQPHLQYTTNQNPECYRLINPKTIKSKKS